LVRLPDRYNYEWTDSTDDAVRLSWQITTPLRVPLNGRVTLFELEDIEVLHVPPYIKGQAVKSISSFGPSRLFENLKAVILPEGLESIERATFYKFTNLVSVTLPESLISIDNSAFMGCVSLTDIILPESLTTIGSGAFMDCVSLTYINLPSGLESIGDGAFYNTGLTSMVWPANLPYIENFMFAFCLQFVSIILPNGFKMLGAYVFQAVPLTWIVIPDSLESIGVNAFCQKTLSQVFFGGDQAAWEAIEISRDNAPLTNATIYFYSEWHFNENGIPEVIYTY
jgi:hypothetical protein